MANNKVITDTALEAALRRVGGLATQAARALGTTRQNVHARIKRSPHLQSVIEQICEETLDGAENAVLKAIERGDGAMARWYLERKGRGRGYGIKGDAEVLPPTTTLDEQRKLDEQARMTALFVGLLDDYAARKAAGEDVPPLDLPLVTHEP